MVRADGIELRGPIEGRFAEILTPAALAFVAELQRELGATRAALLRRIAASPWLHHGLAAATLGLELAFPIALLSPRARCLIVPAAYLMHVGIRVLLGSNFLGLIVVYAFWVPWERLAATLGAARRPAEGPARA